MTGDEFNQFVTFEPSLFGTNEVEPPGTALFRSFFYFFVDPITLFLSFQHRYVTCALLISGVHLPM